MKRKLLMGSLLVVLLYCAAAGAIVVWGHLDRVAAADVALVLGSKVNPDGLPSPRLKARLDKAAELFRAGYFPKIIVSGGSGKEGVAEGTAMKAYLVADGLPEPAIIVDDEGVDTLASADNTVAILRGQNLNSVLVVTQYFPCAALQAGARQARGDGDLQRASGFLRNSGRLFHNPRSPGLLEVLVAERVAAAACRAGPDWGALTCVSPARERLDRRSHAETRRRRVKRMG